MMKRKLLLRPINTMPDGTCLTIKSQYYKNGYANICENGAFGHKGTFACTGVIELYEDREPLERTD